MSESSVIILKKKNYSQQKLSTLNEPHTTSKKAWKYFVFLGFYVFQNTVLSKDKFNQGSILYLAKNRNYPGLTIFFVDPAFFLYEGYLGESLS